LHALSRAKLFPTALAATGFAFFEESGTMAADSRGFGFWFPSNLRRNLGDLFQKVGMLLDCEGSGQQALKGLLVELQLGPVRGHENGGKILRTVLIILQFQKLGTEKFGGSGSVGVVRSNPRNWRGSIPDWGFQSGTGLMKTV
jgi:hypothetical protein